MYFADDMRNTHEVMDEPIQFDNVNSWDDIFDRFLSLPEDQVTELVNEGKIKVVYGENTADTINGDIVFLVNCNVRDVKCNTLISINSTIVGELLYLKNLFMYGGKAYGANYILASNIILGTYRIVRNGNVDIDRNIIPPIISKKNELLTAFILLLSNKSLNCNLNFYEVNCNFPIEVFGSPTSSIKLVEDSFKVSTKNIKLAQFDSINDESDISKLSEYTIDFVIQACSNFKRNVKGMLASPYITDEIRDKIQADINTADQIAKKWKNAKKINSQPVSNTTEKTEDVLDGCFSEIVRRYDQIMRS